jgi:hypothetical protein
MLTTRLRSFALRPIVRCGGMILRSRCNGFYILRALIASGFYIHSYYKFKQKS